MKKYIYIGIVILLIGIFVFLYTTNNPVKKLVFGTTTFNSSQVGSSASNGYVLQTNGTNSTWVSPSTLSGVPDWNKQTNYNVLTLTPTTTIPVWIQDRFFASSSAIFAGDVTASTFTATSTTATSTFAGGLSVAGIAGLTVLQNGNVGIGTTSPRSNLHVSGGVTTDFVIQSWNGGLGYKQTFRVTDNNNLRWLWGYDALENGFMEVNIGGGVNNWDNKARDLLFKSTTAGVGTIMTLKTTGTVGIGTTSPYSVLSISNSRTTTANTPLFTVASTTDGTATSTLFTILNSGNTVIGNNGFVHNFSTGTTTITNLNMGSLTFDNDAGVVPWFDLPLTSASANNTNQSYTANVGGLPLLTVFGQSNGSSYVKNMGVGIGTTSPWGLFSITNNASGLSLASSTIEFVIASTTTAFATTTHFMVDNVGRVSVGTTTLNGLFNLGVNSGTTNASTTISTGKLQYDSYDSGGARRCVFLDTSGAFTSIAGACNQ